MLFIGYFIMIARLKLHSIEILDFTAIIAGQEIKEKRFGKNEIGFLFIPALTIILRLGEPLHGVPAGTISLGATCVLFLSGMLKKEDLSRM